VHKNFGFSIKVRVLKSCILYLYPKGTGLLYINSDLSVRVSHVKSLKTADLIDMCVLNLAVR
jgi:hypothetical protein